MLVSSEFWIFLMKFVIRVWIFFDLLSQTFPLSEAEHDIIVKRLPQKTQEVVYTPCLIYLTSQTIQKSAFPKTL